MRRKAICIFTIAIFLALQGCHAGGASSEQRSSASEPVNPLRVRGTISPRGGLEIPRGAEIEIVVRRFELPHTVFAVHKLQATQSWPASFDFEFDWPNIPRRGEREVKASPPVLGISATGRIDGQVTYIAELKRYTVEASIEGRAVELMLVPVRD